MLRAHSTRQTNNLRRSSPGHPRHRTGFLRRALIRRREPRYSRSTSYATRRLAVRNKQDTASHSRNSRHTGSSRSRRCNRAPPMRCRSARRRQSRWLDRPSPAAMPAAPTSAPRQRGRRCCHGGDGETSCHSESRQNFSHDITSMMDVLSRNPTAPLPIKFPLIGERRRLNPAIFAGRSRRSATTAFPNFLAFTADAEPARRAGYARTAIRAAGKSLP